MRRGGRFGAARVGALIALALAAARAPAQAPAPFDAGAAWSEFAMLLRESYGYYRRPGVDGPAILARFEAEARAAPSRQAFVDVLQVVARNFADPHFIVGPLGPEDHSVIPTASDIYGGYRGGEFLVLETRTDGDAVRRGVRVGSAIVSVDGLAPRAAVERLLGQPFGELSGAQIDHGLNTALAGQRGAERRLVVRNGRRTRGFTLLPTAVQAERVRAGPRLSVERRGRLGVIRIGNSLGDHGLIAAFDAALSGLGPVDAVAVDLRNTPSGGNTTVARAILGRFVQGERPYQVHTIPYEEQVAGIPRKFVEYVTPRLPFFPGRVFAVGGRWTGSMGEGLMIGFDAIGAATVGTDLGDLLGALGNVTLEKSGARVDLGLERLFHVRGSPREDFQPTILLETGERSDAGDPALDKIEAVLARPPR